MKKFLIFVLSLCLLMNFVAAKTLQKSEYANYKTIADFKEADKKIQSLLNPVKLLKEIKDSPLRDGTPRRIYKGDYFLIEVIGRPDVKLATIGFFPTNDKSANLDILTAAFSVFKVFAKPKGSEIDLFFKKFSEALQTKKKVEFTTGSSKVVIESYDAIGAVLMKVLGR